jgi:hypothetical protein
VKFAPIRTIALGCALILMSGMAQALERTPAPAGAKAYIISPADGETVSSPVTVLFGLSGMGVAPAGIEKENTGHHHLIINAELPPMDEGIPADDNYRHYGGGQTQVTLELPAGQHTLQMLVGDHNHVPHDPPIMSEKITITVQ